MWFWKHRTYRSLCAWMLALGVAPGCHHSRPDLHYLGDASDSYYTDHASSIDYPLVADELPPEVAGTEAPHTIRDQGQVPIRDISLAEAVHLALTNSQIIRTGGTFQTVGNPLFSNPDRIDSVYDPAIQNSGVLFGGRGVEAALAAFDTQFNASLLWNSNQAIANTAVPFGTPAFQSNTDGGTFNAALSKTFGYGGSVAVGHDVFYNGSNNPNRLFNSVYSGDVSFQYRQPLLAGAGTEYTRIAGPIGQGFGGLTGVSQGVIISRINNDLALADFESAIHGLLRDVENAYWNLYLSYRTYHAAVSARDSSQSIWDYVNKRLEAGSDSGVELSQAQDQLFATEAASSNAWSQVLTQEIALRRLIGLQVNDGMMLRPADEPTTAELLPDWYSCLTEALNNRVELRRQKWNVKSLELQLRAARSLTKPRLDLVGGYVVNGFGDNLLSYQDADVNGTTQGLNSFYETLSQGDQTGWNVGVQMNVPIGFRSAHAQVKNYELRVAKAQKVLQEQEKEISLELAAAFQEVARAYQAAESNMNRLIAAQENVRLLGFRKEGGTDEADIRLRAVLRQSDAEIAYYQSIIDYNNALTNLQFRKGTILHHNNVVLSEGPWEVEAYADAKHHAKARAHAWENDMLHHEPEAFSSPVPVNRVQFTSPGAAQAAGGGPAQPPVPQPATSAVPAIPVQPMPVQSVPAQPMVPVAPAPVPPAESQGNVPVPPQAPPAVPPQSWVPQSPTGGWVSPTRFESVPVEQPSVPAKTSVVPNARASLNKSGGTKQ